VASRADATGSRPSLASHATPTNATASLTTTAKISNAGCGRSATTVSAVTLARYVAADTATSVTNAPETKTEVCASEP